MVRRLTNGIVVFHIAKDSPFIFLVKIITVPFFSSPSYSSFKTKARNVKISPTLTHDSCTWLKYHQQFLVFTFPTPLQPTRHHSHVLRMFIIMLGIEVLPNDSFYVLSVDLPLGWFTDLIEHLLSLFRTVLTPCLLKLFDTIYQRPPLFFVWSLPAFNH